MIMKYEEYETNPIVQCPVCGWQGHIDDMNKRYPDETVFECWCPGCKNYSVDIGYPYPEYYRKKALAGDPEAIARVGHWDAVKKSWLRDPAQLPDISPSSALTLVVQQDGDGNVSVRSGGLVIWNERWFSGDPERYDKLREMLINRYGPGTNVSREFTSDDARSYFDGWK